MKDGIKGKTGPWRSRANARTGVKNQRKTQKRDTALLKEAVLVVIVVILLILSMVTASRIKDVVKEISTYREEMKALNREGKKLQGEIARLSNKKRLQKIGRSLGLHPPKDSQIVHMK